MAARLSIDTPNVQVVRHPPDGGVLAAGGFFGRASLSSSELFH